ncbi:MAG TPA: isoamylase early set domain-containing protein [Gemmatimonadales bacterium]|nr:isoamylase early set domain-containing protein [Gemmatimonadales bacterium]
MRAEHRKDPEHDPVAERFAARLRDPVPLTDRVERAVLRRLEAEAAERRDDRSRWRKFVAAMALAAGIAIVFGLGVLVGRRSAVPAPTDAEVRSVEFVLRTAADSAVALVGDFNDWDPSATPLRPAADSLWSVVVPLRPGRYRYTFIVDGTRWYRDPSAPRALEDDFGTPTSVITVAHR